MDDKRFIENLLTERMEQHYQHFPIDDLKENYDTIEIAFQKAFSMLSPDGQKAVEAFIDRQHLMQEIGNTCFYKKGVADGVQLCHAILEIVEVQDENWKFWKKSTNGGHPIAFVKNGLN